MSLSSPMYGSIDDNDNDNNTNTATRTLLEDNEEDRTTFDVSETYYLKDTTHVLSPAERRRKCLTSATPVLIAFIIMGTIVLLLLHDFTHLYPSSAVDRHYDSSEEHRGIPVPSPTTTATSIHSADCVDNSKCNELELIGKCCPTVSGDFLDCC
jgi:hypothetical protein